jgi:N-acyl-D-aspartate/D-glutamate deacylase
VDLDVKLSNGRVVDGSGARAFRADVAIAGDRIAAIGDLAELPARETIDCSERLILPGFIDIHSHSDWLVPGTDAGRLVEPFVRQGMTTLVGGNCGFSPAPLSEHNRSAARESSRLIVDDEIELRWETMAEFLDALAGAPLPLNVAELVGHGAIRSAVLGALNPKTPTQSELAAMERLAREALDVGCVGISTGLGYPPGIFSTADELGRVAGWAATAGKLFTSHLRAYSQVSPIYQTDPAVLPHNLAAIDELLSVARGGRARLQISHLIFVGRATWPTCESALARIERARDDGLDVAFDAFPYTAGNTTASVLFPPEMLPHLESILADPDLLADVKQLGRSIFERIGFWLEDIQIMRANAPAFDAYDGLFVGEAAERAGMDVWEFYARLVIDSRRQARVLNHTYSGHEGREEALRQVLAHPLCTIETDTFLTDHGHQNPASYGTFPRVLSTYVEAGLFSFEEAVRKMTGAAAERLALRDRGLVRRGYAADLVVVDPATLRDTATFQSPARFPTGIEHVWINGVHVLDEGRYDGAATAGRLLRG